MSEKNDMKFEGYVKKCEMLGVTRSGKDMAILIVEEKEGKHPQSICASFFGERALDVVKRIREGDFVKVWFNMRINEGRDRIFNSVMGWRVSSKNVIGHSKASADFEENVKSEDTGNNIADVPIEQNDDLPF